MKICYVSSILSIHDERFINKFIEKGYETHIITFGGRNFKESSGVKFYDLELETGSIFSRLPKNLRKFMFFKNLINKIKPDILHAGFVQTDGFLSALTGYHPFFLNPWGSDILILPKKSLEYKLKAIYALKRADFIHCDCQAVIDEIKKLTSCPGKNISKFPVGIDLHIFSRRSGREIRVMLNWQGKKILIMTRNFYPVYSIDTFIKSLPEVIKEEPDTRAILCGEGPLKEEIKQLTENLGLKEYVYFAGSVTNNRLPEFYGAADIYVSSSLSDGASLSLLEGMACCLPAVVSGIKSNLEWVTDGENAYTFTPGNSRMLGVKLIQLLKDTNIQKTFGEKNRQIALDKADWNKNFDIIEKTYQELIIRKAL